MPASQCLPSPCLDRVLSARLLSGRVCSGRVCSDRVLSDRVLPGRVLASLCEALADAAGEPCTPPASCGRRRRGLTMDLAAERPTIGLWPWTRTSRRRPPEARTQLLRTRTGPACASPHGRATVGRLSSQQEPHRHPPCVMNRPPPIAALHALAWPCLALPCLAAPSLSQTHFLTRDAEAARGFARLAGSAQRWCFIDLLPQTLTNAILPSPSHVCPRAHKQILSPLHSPNTCISSLLSPRLSCVDAPPVGVVSQSPPRY